MNSNRSLPNYFILTVLWLTALHLVFVQSLFSQSIASGTVSGDGLVGKVKSISIEHLDTFVEKFGKWEPENRYAREEKEYSPGGDLIEHRVQCVGEQFSMYAESDACFSKKVYAYFAAGKVRELVKYDPDGNAFSKTLYNYDQKSGRLIEISFSRKEGDKWESDEIEYLSGHCSRIAYTYDRLSGKAVEVATFDSAGVAVYAEKLINAAGKIRIENIHYQAEGKIERKTVRRNNVKCDKAEEIAHYNGNGELMVADSTDGSFAKRVFVYDGKCNLSEMSSYNSDGELLDRIKYAYGGGKIVERSHYNEKGELVERDDGDETCAKVRYKYDTGGNLSEEAFYSSDGHLNRKYTFVNNVRGDVLEKGCFGPDGVLEWKNRYQYHGKCGHMIEESYFDGSGLLTNVDFGNDSYARIGYSYDDKCRLAEQVKRTADGSTNIMIRYYYDSHGNLTGVYKGNLVVKFGEVRFEPFEAEERTIIYY